MNELPPDIRDASAQDAEAARVVETPEPRATRIGSMTERMTAPRGA